MELSAENRDNIKGKIDSDHVCNVNITMKAPDLGLQIMDHPGFAATLEEPVKKTFKETLDEHFHPESPNRKDNATVLLCHRFGQQRSKAFYPKMCKDYYQKVKDGCMFMGITQVDRLHADSEFIEFTKDLKAKYP